MRSFSSAVSPAALSVRSFHSASILHFFFLTKVPSSSLSSPAQPLRLNQSFALLCLQPTFIITAEVHAHAHS